MVFFTALLSRSYAQFKSLSGSIGGEYRKQDYLYQSGQSLYSRFSQLVELQTNGYLYNPNLVEFNLHSQFMNANSSTYYLSSNTKQKENYFDFYDLNIEILRSSNFPVIIFLRNDLNTNTVKAPFGQTINNQVFTNSKGLIFSPKLNGAFNSKISLFTFRYNDTRTYAPNPNTPVDQKNQDFQVSFDLPQFLKTQIGVEAIHRRRSDNIKNMKYQSDEVHLRGVTQAGAVDQVSFNANFWKESTFSSIMASAFWNSQRFQDIINQLNCQFRVTNTGSSSILDGSINEQLNINFSQNLSGNIIASHQETYSNSLSNKATLRNSVLMGGINYQGNLDKFLMNLVSNVSYQRSQNSISRNSIQGMFSAGVQSQGFSFGNISLSDQFSVRKYFTTEPLVLYQNTVSSSIESNIAGNLFLRANGNFSLNGSTDSSGFRDKNFTLLTSLTYQSFKLITFYLTLNYGRDWFSNSFLKYSINRYSATLQLPNLFQNFTLQGRLIKTFNAFQNDSEFNYDVVAAYTWRALEFSLRLTGYSISTMKRKDLFFTVSRPFSVNFD
ncbi:MAG: hypothetical protein ACYCVH_07635 [Ignavibacteriaceae bacterium]